ncbi:MAG: GlsB/YeaQ/YmgE family stress response membrane protein [Acidobacteriota bacterium]|nr:GlsB/YeaQ/YmgE family stress response membrane protein [Acidobacteriota bacterium]
MTIASLLTIFLVGLITGWLMWLSRQSSGKGFLLSLFITLTGAFAGGILFERLSMETISVGGEILRAFAGAVGLFLLVGIVQFFCLMPVLRKTNKLSATFRASRIRRDN